MLTPATCHDAPGKVVWSPKMLEAFSHLRSVLCSDPWPGRYLYSADRCLCWWSGCSFERGRDDKILSVAFLSKQPQGAERRYSATELKGLAVYRSVTFFAHFLYGREFTVYTDHQALVSMRFEKAMNRRVHGWALKLQDFSFRIVYRRGVANANADGLSRHALVEDAEDGRQISAGGCGGVTPMDTELHE